MLQPVLRVSRIGEQGNENEVVDWCRCGHGEEQFREGDAGSTFPGVIVGKAMGSEKELWARRNARGEADPPQREG